MKKAKVVIKDISVNPDEGALYQSELADSIKEIFEDFGGGKSFLKTSQDVFIKPNAIDAKQYCFTRAEVLEALIEYFFSIGANNIYIFENSTQCNHTRIVFESAGYHNVCKRTGARPIYLDEEKTIEFNFEGKKSVSEDPEGYFLKSFKMPKTVVEKIIEGKDENLYINLPKLKTHSMTGVTLGIKNQWAFPSHYDRKFDHNYNLHSKLIDVLQIVQPDFTLIEGIEGTIHGHYPPTSLADKLVKPFKVLIGGQNIVATDLVGAKIFGLDPEDVPHLKIAIDRGIGEINGLSDVEIGGNLSRFTEKYPYTLYPELPPDVNIIQGKELVCDEGCKNNPYSVMQVLYCDYGGKGAFDLVIGKGHEPNIIDNLKGPVLIAGQCAIEEVGERLVKRLGKRKVYISDSCNNLTKTAEAMFHLMHVSPLRLVTLNPIKSISLLIQAKLHKSKANVPSIFSNILKKA